MTKSQTKRDNMQTHALSPQKKYMNYFKILHLYFCKCISSQFYLFLYIYEQYYMKINIEIFIITQITNI